MDIQVLTADTAAAAEWAARKERIDIPGLEDMAADVRRSVVTMIDRAGLGHIGGDLSVTDILVTLFGAVLDVDPADPARPDRDRFILSKGHCAGALYATLAHCGFFPRDRAEHVHGAAVGAQRPPEPHQGPGRGDQHRARSATASRSRVGCALAAKLRGADCRTFVVLGDGELQEGSNWEAAMTAAHYGLANLTAIVDRNRLQQGARTEDTKRLEPLADKWIALRLGGRARSTATTTAQLLEALGRPPTGRPSPSSPTRSRARASRSWRTASSGTTRCPAPSRSRPPSRS